MVSGSLGTEDRRVQIEEGRLNGTMITFRIGDTSDRGQVDQAQTTMRGVAQTPDGTEDWRATRVP